MLFNLNGLALYFSWVEVFVLLCLNVHSGLDSGGGFLDFWVLFGY